MLEEDRRYPTIRDSEMWLNWLTQLWLFMKEVSVYMDLQIYIYIYLTDYGVPQNEKKCFCLHRDAIPNQVMLATVGKLLRCFLETMDRTIPDLRKKYSISCWVFVWGAYLTHFMAPLRKGGDNIFGYLFYFSSVLIILLITNITLTIFLIYYILLSK